MQGGVQSSSIKCGGIASGVALNSFHTMQIPTSTATFYLSSAGGSNVVSSVQQITQNQVWTGTQSQAQISQSSALTMCSNGNTQPIDCSCGSDCNSPSSSSSSSSLSNGAIAGIVIGVIVGVAICLLIICCLIMSRLNGKLGRDENNSFRTRAIEDSSVAKNPAPYREEGSQFGTMDPETDVELTNMANAPATNEEVETQTANTTGEDETFA